MILIQNQQLKQYESIKGVEPVLFEGDTYHLFIQECNEPLSVQSSYVTHILLSLVHLLLHGLLLKK